MRERTRRHDKLETPATESLISNMAIATHGIADIKGHPPNLHARPALLLPAGEGERPGDAHQTPTPDSN